MTEVYRLIECEKIEDQLCVMNDYEIYNDNEELLMKIKDKMVIIGENYIKIFKEDKKLLEVKDKNMLFYVVTDERGFAILQIENVISQFFSNIL
ncbi:hypothetical protein SBFV2_gp68 [Sulfolobales Beppu filamentous virus 2]|uniref:Uncharacterized protein n=1 Tax=Sulfolobales Beppu filamentous virus 2 TaxID=2493123 RepID=A0A3S8NF22_9VIRU|nr:hypothetical protein HOU84_gp68 [Sulfolobales Beppu filamentous virus 2]AZI75835.1 hypothetical protein SBFV2_gp68 [Sulfolobales Beppu filamentous virus 2]